ncbi:regulator of G protein-like protein [Rhizodiscina lignyota]|uniref:Regulator of G protein-like protein n=1 Tax=Rhizodiscina lignyota TaxID=1504668 RepID=A0A9P4M206_9PEZI|nr:regulator of G protein-like protein [Rhizodiscina lignyota]
MSILFYKRPDYITKPDGPLNKTECQRYVEKYKHLQGRTPPELSFENVIEGRALPVRWPFRPCTLSDFMDYLVYVERNAENLQFYLWLRDYTRRFEALKPEEQALSPVWNVEEGVAPDGLPVRSSRNPSVYEREIDFDGTRPGTRNGRGHESNASVSDVASFMSKSTQGPMTIKNMETISEDANSNVGLKWQGFSCQPFRAEITRVIAHYIAPESPRELNLSHRDRGAVLHALQHTTHPSALASVKTLVEAVLKGQAHPNFVRWSVCNGNKPKVLFVRTMGTTMILLALIAMILLILSRAPRWWRITPCALLWLGITNLVASKKGMCMILTLNHQRDLKPWELDADPASTFGIICKPMIEAAIEGALSTHDEKTKHWTLDSFGTTNEWDQEEWVNRYTKRPLLKRAFPGSTWVQAEGIRQLQSKIVRESQLWGLALTIIIVTGFTAIPNGNFF